MSREFKAMIFYPDAEKAPKMPRVMGPNTLKWLMEKIPAFNETWKKTTHLREKMEREVTDKQKG